MAAKFKKTAKKTSGKTRSAGAAGKGAGAQEQAERLSKTLSESAQQIWLAGVGAFGRAQAEGTKLFEGLVK
ncbi:phasin family protein, partial [Streptomyces sp. S9]|nr:phasin family protein [Streptomyces sp. S9]